MAFFVSSDGPTRRIEDVRLGFVGDDVRCAASFDQTDVESRWADLRLDRQRHRQHVVERLDELVDGGVAEFGIGRVGHAAFGAEFDAEGALGGEGEAVVGGLAVDEELRSFGRLVGDDGSGGVAFLADEKEQTDLDACLAESVCGRYLRGDDALCVAGAAAVEELVVFARAEERRHGVHVGRKHDIRGDAGERGVDVEALAAARPRSAGAVRLFDWHALDGVALRGQIFVEKNAG